MTSKEFTFWLEGFKESIDGVPTKEQWELIQEKLSEVVEEKDLTSSNPFLPLQLREMPKSPPWSDIIWAGGPTTAIEIWYS